MKDSIQLISKVNPKGKPISYIVIDEVFLLTLNIVELIKSMHPNDNGVIEDRNEDGLIYCWRKIKREGNSRICFYVNGELFREFYYHDFIDYAEMLISNSNAKTELTALA